MRPAFENIPKKVITSKMTNQLPIFDAPYGKGRLSNLTNFSLSTYISRMFDIKAIM